MANHKSAVKRHAQSVKRNARNRVVRTHIKNAVKSVRAAVRGEDRSAAGQALSLAMSVLDRAATRKVIHWKKAARKISRLSRAVQAMGDQSCP